MLKVRPELEIFADLAQLCASPGYVHSIGYFSFRDNIIRYRENLDVEAMASEYDPERLLRTEIATLIGLMVQQPIDDSLPSPPLFQEYIDRTQALLKELHHALSSSWFEGMSVTDGTVTRTEPLWTGRDLREPFFYSGESAYGFQYRALAVQKYKTDNGWLMSRKGFGIEDAVAVAQAAAVILTERQMANQKAMRKLPPDQWTMLPGFVFSVEDIQANSGLDSTRIEAVLDAFTLPENDRNTRFTALHDFNAMNATPLLRWEGRQYLLLQHYSLLEAIYESPIFWMMADKAYKPTAIAHRGAFTETFAADCLEKVFKPTRVFRNIDIYRPDGNRLGEIDVLAIFGKRAVLVQAKSKRLTIEARKGNDLQIKDDFKKAVQDAADQAYLCAVALLDPAYKLKDTRGHVIEFPRAFNIVHPLCIVSDHYPALAFQARHFLRGQSSEQIAPPIVTDVFALDVMAEMLASPLHFLHYLTLRTRFGHKLTMSHELTQLGEHLARNLWFDDKYDMVTLADDIATHLDIAMLVRREGVPGERTPEGILTRLKDTTFGRLLGQIEDTDDPDVGELGLLLLQLGEDTARNLGAGIDAISKAAQRDRHPHDLSLLLGEGESGLTVHCRYLDNLDAMPKLLAHCQMRKYSTKSDSWYGLLVDPDTLDIRTGVGSHEPWRFDPRMEELAKQWPLRQPVPLNRLKQQLTRKVGRNEPCPCGSGRKYKHCCRS